MDRKRLADPMDAPYGLRLERSRAIARALDDDARALAVDAASLLLRVDYEVQAHAARGEPHEAHALLRELLELAVHAVAVAPSAVHAADAHVPDTLALQPGQVVARFRVLPSVF